MKKLLILLVLLIRDPGYVRGDPNIYGPGGVNLGPEGNPELLFEHAERQRQKAVVEESAESVLTLRPQDNGYYLIDGTINDISLVFALDTGASLVALPEAIASKAGIECQREAYLQTANGTAEACAGNISKLKFGDFTLTDVQCVIAPKLHQALLGNNVLKSFKIVQHGGQIQISR